MIIGGLIDVIKINLNKSPFSKNFLTLFSGSIIAQIIPIIASPFIARLFPPTEFGLLAIFTAIESFLLIFSSMQYELAIMLPEDDSEAFHLLILSLLITIFVSAISALTILFFNKNIAILLNSPELAGWLFLIPIEILILGSFKSLNVWASRYKKYRRISFRQITQSITQSVAKIIFGLLNFISGGLIVGMILGEFTSTLGLCRSTLKEDKKFFYKIDIKKIIQLAKKYDQFPKYSSPHGFIDIFSKNGIIFIINHFFSASVLGLFSFANNLLRKPLLLIGNNIRQVFFQSASEKYRNDKTKLWPFTKKIILYLFLGGIILFLPLLFWGPQIFAYVFGERWKEAGVYSQYLTPWLLMNFVLSPISSVPMILGQQKIYFFITTINNVGIPIIMIILFFNNFNLITALIYISIFVIGFSFYTVLWIKKICTIKDQI